MPKPSLCIVVTGRDGRRSERALADGEFLIGRKNDNHVVLGGDDVSHHHAKLLVEGGRVTIMDLASTTGTYVNGLRVLRRDLGLNDHVRIGPYDLHLTDAPSTPSALVEEATATARARPLSPESAAEATAPIHARTMPMPRIVGDDVRAAQKGPSSQADTLEQKKVGGSVRAVAQARPGVGEDGAPPVTLEDAAAPEDAAAKEEAALGGADARDVPVGGNTEPMPAFMAADTPPSGSPLGGDGLPGGDGAARAGGADGGLGADDLLIVEDDLGTDRRPPIDVRPIGGVSTTAPTTPMRRTQKIDATSVRAGPGVAPAAVRPEAPRGVAHAPTLPPSSLGGASASGRAAARGTGGATPNEKLWLEQVEVLDVPRGSRPASVPRVEDKVYLELLCRAAAALHAAPDAEATCERAFALLWETIVADVGVLFLVGESGTPAPVVVRSKEKIPLGEVPVSRTVVDRVLRDRVALHCADLRDDTRFHAGSSLFLFNVRSVVAVPLLAGEVALGAVYLHRGPGTPFETRDLEVVVAAAHMVAMALERWRVGTAAGRTERLRAAVAAHLTGPEADVVADRLALAATRDPADASKAFVVDTLPAVVLCAGERGSAPVGERFQEDELAAYFGELHHLVREAVRAEGGIVAGEGPDVVLALFPLEGGNTQRPAAIRALRAAAQMRAACAGRLPRIAGAGLSIGLDAGVVDAGFALAGERLVYVALGGPLAGARNLQARAGPSEVLLTAQVEALLSGAVSLRPGPDGGRGGLKCFFLPPGSVLA